MKENINNEKGKRKAKGKSYWLDDVFIDQGWAWASEEIEADNGHYDLMPLCLGKESEIVPVLKGSKPIPEDMHLRRKAILEEILGTKEKENERVSKPTTRAISLQRGRLIRNPRRIKRGLRHA